MRKRPQQMREPLGLGLLGRPQLRREVSGARRPQVRVDRLENLKCRRAGGFKQMFGEEIQKRLMLQ